MAERWFKRGDWIRYDGRDYQFAEYCQEGRPQNQHGYVRFGDYWGEGWDVEHVEWLDLAEFVCEENDPRFFVGAGI